MSQHYSVKKYKTNMYTAKLIKGEFEDGYIVADVEFTDGVKSIGKRFKVIGDLLGVVKRTIDELNATKNLDSSLSLGVITMPNEVVDQAVVEKNAYANDLIKLKRIDTAIKLGILTGNEAFITTLRNKLKTDFKSEFIDLF